MKRPYFATFPVFLPTARYHVECRVVPARYMAHLSITSPAWKPGTRGSVQIIRVLRNAVDVTDRLDADTVRAVRENCQRQAGVHGSVLAIPAGQSELPLECAGRMRA